MTVEELKQNKNYEFQLDTELEDIINNYDSTEEYEMWGAAFVFVGNMGVEYNFSIEWYEGEQISNSANYKTDTFGEYLDTNYSMFKGYDLDPCDAHWKENLENAMCEALIKFWDNEIKEETNE